MANLLKCYKVGQREGECNSQRLQTNRGDGWRFREASSVCSRELARWIDTAASESLKIWLLTLWLEVMGYLHCQGEIRCRPT